MPLNVTVRINSEILSVLHIGRMESLRGEDQDHEYLVTDQVIYGLPSDWRSVPDWDKGIPLQHNYADGHLVLVEKAIAAFLEERENDQAK